jgi:hypothetical protein
MAKHSFTRRSRLFLSFVSSCDDVWRQVPNLGFDELQCRFQDIADSYRKKFAGDLYSLLKIERTLATAIFIVAVEKKLEKQMIIKYYRNLQWLGFPDLSKQVVRTVSLFYALSDDWKVDESNVIDPLAPKMRAMFKKLAKRVRRQTFRLIDDYKTCYNFIQKIDCADR